MYRMLKEKYINKIKLVVQEILNDSAQVRGFNTILHEIQLSTDQVEVNKTIKWRSTVKRHIDEIGIEAFLGLSKNRLTQLLPKRGEGDI